MSVGQWGLQQPSPLWPAFAPPPPERHGRSAEGGGCGQACECCARFALSLIHISEPTRLALI
eukprot:2432383-Alexandrium_andersonii.AAC.1